MMWPLSLYLSLCSILELGDALAPRLFPWDTTFHAETPGAEGQESPAVEPCS